METIEARSARHHWKIEPHLHQVLHQMIFVLRGRGVTLAEGARAQYRPPALVLIPAGTVHGFEFEPGTSGHVISMSNELQRELVRYEPGVGGIVHAPADTGVPARRRCAPPISRAPYACWRANSRARIPGTAWHCMAGCRCCWAMCCAWRRTCPTPADPVVGQRRMLVARFSEMVERRFRNNQGVAAYSNT